MSTGDTDKMKPRKQFLNVVYFVDSSRTRTLKIPMSRVYLLLFCALTLIGWAVSSTAVISLLVKDRTDLALSLRQSMQTVFDFESLYDGVYETAYPVGKLHSTKMVKATTKETVPEKPSEPAKSDVANETKPMVKPVDKGEEKSSEKPADIVGKKDTAKESDTKASGTNVEVIVSNPVVKSTPDRLNLTFDLTNKDESGKSEGYLWATAEFKTDAGVTHILKAPPLIDANIKGEISDHRRASYFAIRRFKRNEFSFELMQGHTGTVIGVKIGISDKPGENKMIYDVPLGIKVGTAQEKAKTDSAGKKAGQG